MARSINPPLFCLKSSYLFKQRIYFVTDVNYFSFFFTLSTFLTKHVQVFAIACFPKRWLLTRFERRLYWNTFTKGHLNYYFSFSQHANSFSWPDPASETSDHSMILLIIIYLNFDLNLARLLSSTSAYIYIPLLGITSIYFNVSSCYNLDRHTCHSTSQF